MAKDEFGFLIVSKDDMRIMTNKSLLDISNNKDTYSMSTRFDALNEVVTRLITNIENLSGGSSV